MKRAWIVLVVLIIMCGGALAFGGCSLFPTEELTSYTIDGVLDVQTNTLTATSKVEYHNNTDSILDSVYFHLYPSAYREGAVYAPVGSRYLGDAYPTGISYGGIAINEVLIGDETAAYQIGGSDENMLILSSITLYPGDSVNISISFTLTIPCIRHRFGHYDGTINLGNWYPIASIYEDGEWRTDPYYSAGDPFYSEAADYNVSLTVPTGYEVAGTGRVSASISGDYTIVSFSASNVRDFAMSVSNKFAVATATAGDVTVRYYYLHDNSYQTQVQAVVDAISTFSEMFGAYAYENITVVQTPFVYGGMEYPQLVFISDALSGEMLIDTIIHEIAHQWWYAAVGSDQINNAWMDEGLSEYSATMFYEKNPSYGIQIADRIADAMQGYILFTELYVDEIGGVTSMNRSLGDFFSQIDYNYHTYVKGELLFDSLRHMLGDGAFFAALKNYYADFSGGIARVDDMIGAFEGASNLNLKSFFDNWVEGKVGIYASYAA